MNLEFPIGTKVWIYASPMLCGGFYFHDDENLKMQATVADFSAAQRSYIIKTDGGLVIRNVLDRDMKLRE